MCGTAMDSRPLGDGEVRLSRRPRRLPRRADLGTLVEAESDWHAHAGQHTMPMPRITADMTAPPRGKDPVQAWVETLF